MLTSSRPYKRYYQMARKRKQPPNSKAPVDLPLEKRVKYDKPVDGSIYHPVLSLYYSRIMTLRDYLHAQLPASSKSRRRKIASIGLNNQRGTPHTLFSLTLPPRSPSSGILRTHEETQIIADVLDSTLVGILKESDRAINDARQKEFAAYTQSKVRSSLEYTNIGATISQSDIVDFAILSLFKRFRGSFYKPPHLLCHGFQRATGQCRPDHEHDAMVGIPGVVPQYPNKNVSTLKNSPWTDVFGLLGQTCAEVMLHLLLDCAVFTEVDGKNGSFYQLSGIPLSELNALDLKTCKMAKGATDMDTAPVEDSFHSPANIIFVRSRMLYARAAVDNKGRVKFGLRHTHVLNRYPESTNRSHTVHIMKYIFPRQFDLHNVFTSALVSQHPLFLPPSDVQLLEQTQHLGSKPSSSTKLNVAFSQGGSAHKLLMTDYATPTASVSAFCRAVLLKLVPNELYGDGENGIKNRDIIMRHVDSFVRLRRFESLSLHEVVQGLKITCVKWLQPPSRNEIHESSSAKLSSSDIRKRTEIFLEVVYYIFDSLLIPLIRSNFYVTESSIHRNRLFYFRHDIWRRLAEPPILQLKLSIFEEVRTESAERILSGRNLGYSSLRLLPKSSGARPIVNLRRRPARKCGWGGLSELGPSINSLMAPAFNVLNYEKRKRLGMLGSTLFSIGDIYSRLKAFKERKMPHNVARTKPFYLVKLDIQSCFDTIPQQRLIQLASRLVAEDEYIVTKHVEIRPPDETPNAAIPNHHIIKAKPARKFISKATGFADLTSLCEVLTGREGKSKKHTIFVNTSTYKKYQRNDILRLLEEHIRNNLVKMGKRYFRQKTGIPQGSIVSTLLCNFFYSEFEREHLAFLDCDNALLLRLIDDYLLITTEPDLASRFLHIMLQGNQEYGISVNPEKILVNFTTTIQGHKLPGLLEPYQRQFPYCGNFIDTYTLSLMKDRTPKDPSLTTSDTLTVEANKTPGVKLYLKAVNSFKMQAHAMFLDTKHNSPSVALMSIYHIFLESAMKLYEYTRFLGYRGHRGRRNSTATSSSLLIRTMAAVIDVAIHVILSRKSTASQAGFESSVTRSQVRWLAAAAFKSIFGRKQTKFVAAIHWLNGVSRASEPIADGEAVMLQKVVKNERFF
ncbi:telomerase reverse transcriptase [Paracoccidioides brasiliensis Pb18]|uniref:Telomerase reverse transcriptase n=1 Tax=Paracoccidioides brasiliensis (strain Pb18) TaxID=502780 RepID=A0A0A0HFU6_PARBD|nr:telomerase reverse transcriptase [Paracoccidioides brasiliensis Pb18]KGM85836.1 hypothetical protein PADG_12533 [Paracoccidioides brasiliensis Pb18]